MWPTSNQRTRRGQYKFNCCEDLAARFWRFRSRSATRRHVYVASASRYPPRSRNCGRLLVAATQSSRLNQ